MIAPTRLVRRLSVALAIAIACAYSAAPTAQIPTRNVNMVSGLVWPSGDTCRGKTRSNREHRALRTVQRINVAAADCVSRIPTLHAAGRGPLDSPGSGVFSESPFFERKA